MPKVNVNAFGVVNLDFGAYAFKSMSLRGDVHWYVAQGTPQFDAEIAEKGHFWMDTSWMVVS